MPRRELFDLAVERADTYLSRLLPGWERNKPGAPELAAAIELWYLRTRFAYRVPLEDVVAVLLAKPPLDPNVASTQATAAPTDDCWAPADLGAAATVWRGGPDGSWSNEPRAGTAADSEPDAG